MSMIDDRLWDVAGGGDFNYDGAIDKLWRCSRRLWVGHAWTHDSTAVRNLRS